MTRTLKTDVVIVGAGLAGLVTAATLTRAGVDAVLVERSPRPGGRAASERIDGFHLDRGPRALYVDGPAERILTTLGVDIPAHRPALDGLLLLGEAPFTDAVPLPVSPYRMLTSPALPGRARWQVLKRMAGLPRARPTGTVRDWTAGLSRPAARYLEALVRLTTYTAAPDLLSAATAAEQLRMAFRGVRYVDGGWQTLVDGLMAIADVRRVEGRAERWTDGTLHLADGRRVEAHVPVVAGGPSTAATLYGRPCGGSGIAARAACLTVALDRLPQPAHRFAIGLHTPLYVSAASETADLAPDGAAVVHGLAYLGPDARGAPRKRLLEAAFDRLQSGWRDHVRHTRWLPEMVVHHRIPTAADGGLAGRPGIEPHPGCFIAGDWVGREGMLADAAVASADAVARAIVERLRRTTSAAG